MAKKNSLKNDQHAAFTTELLDWHRTENRRQMPWKGEKDPYKIWLSEVILQQTRVEQGLKYYQRFVDSFPTIQALAAAPDDVILKHWEGLGYYSRCRNLIATAREVTNLFSGQFPTDYQAVRKLRGIGEYTASAICSFAYNQSYAVLDGNVFRVLSRIHNDFTPVDSTAGKAHFTALARKYLSTVAPGEYNQAIMDFGATICKPIPICTSCFYQHSCQSYQHTTQSQLPVKTKALALKKRWLNYFIIFSQDHLLVRQRIGKDIWQQLYEFYLIETEKATSDRSLLKLLAADGIDVRHIATSKFSQKLTHQQIAFKLLEVMTTKRIHVPGYTWVPVQAVSELPFPRTLQIHLQQLLKLYWQKI